MIKPYKKFLTIMGLVCLSASLINCDGETDSAGSTNDKETPVDTPVESPSSSTDEANELLKRAAARARDKAKHLSFEEFEKTVYREPFEGGKYIVNGDTTIANEKLLREFFETQIKTEPREQEFRVELIVHQVGGLDAVWNSNQKTNLTYCVSTAFDTNYQEVVNAMTNAGNAWETVAQVNFIHDTSHDDNCTASNSAVMFDVRPVNVNGQYLARAFFPNEARTTRNLLIDNSALQLPPGDTLQLVGILRHELGHGLGFRHEHTRPESGTCFEDNDWRPLNDYDPFSVMHYPQCNGQGDWSLTLTDKDKNGAACLYGAAPGFNNDPGQCLGGDVGDDTGSCPGVARTEEITNQNVNKGEEKHYGPFTVQPGSLFVATMTGGSGDPDLYTRFGAQPLRVEYDCRPYLSGPNEECSLDVPQNQTMAYVMVYGYSAGNFNLSITHTVPATQ